MDGMVGNVVEAGFFVYIGPLEVFVSRAVNVAKTARRLACLLNGSR